jgi:hypothetical protein
MSKTYANTRKHSKQILTSLRSLERKGKKKNQENPQKEVAESYSRKKEKCKEQVTEGVIKFKTPPFATNFSACFISCTYSLYVSALISGHLQVISYNVLYSKDSDYIYYFNGSVEELLH